VKNSCQLPEKTGFKVEQLLFETLKL